MAYAELHTHSNFSFLDGASHPEELAAEAVRLGLSALALTDHNGLYGVVRFAEAARAFGLPTVFGAELTITGLGPSPARTGVPDPGGTHLVVLGRGEAPPPAVSGLADPRRERVREGEHQLVQRVEGILAHRDDQLW